MNKTFGQLLKLLSCYAYPIAFAMRGQGGRVVDTWMDMWIQALIGTVPDTLDIHNRLTNIMHRFDHQPGLDESPSQNSAAFLEGLAFRVDLVSSIINESRTHQQMLAQADVFEKGF